MKRCFFPAVALALLPTVASPQGATAPVTVTVQSDVTLTRTGTTSFGTVGNTARTITIDPTSPAPDQSTALFTAAGTSNANVIVNFDATTDLCHEASGCGEKVVFTSHVKGSADGPNPFSARFADVPNGGTVRLNPDGNHYFLLGGSIQTAAGQPAGVYSGVFSMRVVYE
jgi:hypothetical protein